MTSSHHTRTPHEAVLDASSQTSVTSLRLRLLGGFTISLGDRAIDQSAWRLRKAQSLVELLALAPGHRLHRERAMDLLWPDLDLDAAANNLHYALHVARSTLAQLWVPLPAPGTLLRLRRKVIALELGVPLWVDVDAFEAAAAHARHCREVTAYEAAAALYTGELLPEDRYDDWTIGRREGLRQIQLELLMALAASYRSHGAWHEAEGAWKQVLVLEPAHEDAHIALMQLYAEMGHRHQAIRQYERLQETLQRDLGIGPTETSQRLYEDIVSGKPIEPTPSAQATAIPAGPPIASAQPIKSSPDQSTVPAYRPISSRRAATSTGPLIGREAAMDRVRAAWAEAASQPRLLLVSGEAGIGKTRLVEEVVVWAGRQGIAIAEARCYAAEGALPFAPLTEWLRTDTLWPRLLNLEPLWQAEVVRIVPELQVEKPELPSPSPISEVWQRQRWFEALAHAVLACEQALLLILDDLQWCDRETVEWLRFLLRQERQAPLLLLGTLRIEEVDAHHPVAPLRSELRRTGQLNEIELGPLDAGATAMLGAEVSGRELDSDRAAWLYAETEGNPLFVVQLVREGAVGRISADSGDVGIAGARAMLPATLQAVIAARLGNLSDEARELTGLAATIGREFGFELLAQASQLGSRDEDVVVRGLEELIQRRIMREHGSNAYGFSHDKIREVAYAGLTAARRRSLHRRVAQALEVVHGPALEPVSGQIAEHYEQAGQFTRAIPFYVQAAEYVRLAGARRKEVALLSAVIHLAEGEGKKDLIAELRAKLSQAYYALAMWPEADHELKTVLAGLGPDQQEQRVQLLLSLAKTRQLYFDFPETRHYAAEALELAEKIGRKDLAFDALSTLGFADSSSGDLHRSLERFQLALSLASGDDQLPPSGTLATEWSGMILYWLGRYKDANEQMEQALELAHRTHNSDTLVTLLANLGLVLAGTGQYAQAFESFDAAQKLAKEHEAWPYLARAIAMCGGVHLDVFDFAGAQALAEEAREISRSVGWPNATVSAGIDLILNFARRHEVGRAEQLIAEVAQVELQGQGHHHWLRELRLAEARAEVALARGDWEASVSWAEDAIAQSRRRGRVKYEVAGLSTKGLGLVGLDRKPEAVIHLQQAITLAREVGDPAMFLRTAAVQLALDGDDTLLAEARAAADRIVAALPLGELVQRFEDAGPVRLLGRSI